VPALVELQAEDDAAAGATTLLGTMMRNAWGVLSPPTSDDARVDARVYRAARGRWPSSPPRRLDGQPLSNEDVVAALERTNGIPASGELGRVAVIDYERARTRVFEVASPRPRGGGFPRRARPSPLLDDDLRRELGSRLERPDA
jgi:hypothetical protein